MICDKAKECNKMRNCDHNTEHNKYSSCAFDGWCGGKCIPYKTKEEKDGTAKR